MKKPFFWNKTINKHNKKPNYSIPFKYKSFNFLESVMHEDEDFNVPLMNIDSQCKIYGLCCS